MRTLDHYIRNTIIAATLTVLAVLFALFTFFALIEELEAVGKGNYGMVQVLVFVAAMSPRLAYDLFPMAALIGTLMGLGAMVQGGEIAVVRCAGVSKLRLVGTVMKAATLFVLVAFVVGELVSPPAEQFARRYKVAQKQSGAALETRDGFWARDGSSYINIRRILPGNELRGIYIHEFDEDSRLRASTFAERAVYEDGQWLLRGISQTLLEDGRLESRAIGQAAWNSVLKPDLIAMVAIEPSSLSIATLARYIHFLRGNGQEALRYEHALWVKLTYPLATAVMVFLAIPLVLQGDRSSTVGRRILVGGLIGLGFHLANQAGRHLGVVYDLAPALSATAPALVMLAAGFVMLRRSV